MVIELSYYSLTLTHSHMRSKQKMYTRTFGMTKTFSITATIQRTHYIIAMLIRRSLENSKTNVMALIPITEFVGLKSKMYSYIKSDEKGGKTTEGIKKNVIKNNIKHEDYKNVLLINEQLHHKMKTIRSQKHQLGSFEINKVSLSCFDDKRYIHDNGISSYAYGHNKIE